GISSSKEQTRGVVEGALNVGAERASTKEAQARQFALGQEQLDIRRQRNESLAAFEFEQIRGQERGRRSQAIGGALEFGFNLLTTPFGSKKKTTTLLAGGGSQTVTSRGTVGGALAAGTISILRTIFSSIRYKENISDMGEIDSKRIYDLDLVRFNYKEDAPVSQSEKETVQYGLIAEEVANVIPEMVVFDEQGRAKMIDYSKLVPLLLKELQEMKKALSMEVI
ncbi:hypothetical protein LCGC14_1297440, partial [marine sediment metagenome]